MLSYTALDINTLMSALLFVFNTIKEQIGDICNVHFTGISVLGDVLECVGLELLDNVPHLLLHQKLNVRHPEYGYTVCSIYMY